MTQLTTKEQTKHRGAFIEEANLKAWSAACHAAFLEKSLTDLIAEYRKMQEEDRDIEAAIKANAEGVNYHTAESCEKRTTMQKQRTNIANAMKLIAKNINEGTTVMQNLLNSVDQNLSLADFAKDWSWLQAEKSTADVQVQNEVAD